MLYSLFILNLFSKGKFDIKNPEESLLRLVDDCENSPCSLKSIPKEFIKYFSIPGLINSLNIQIPESPAYNRSFVERKMKKKLFDTPNELADYIKTTFEYSFDRLYAIFYYEAANIYYDMESFLSNKTKIKNYEEIIDVKFDPKKDYSFYMREMSKNCEIQGIKIDNYYSFVKKAESDPSNLPSKPQSNHASILIKYNNQLFYTEPAFSSNLITDSETPNFLNPIEKTLSKGFPIKSNFSLPSSYKYDQFKNLMPYQINNFNFKMESHPFWKYDNYDDFIKFQFSCNPKVNNIRYQFKIVNDETNYHNYVNLETITDKNKKRIYLYVSFPKQGLFELNLWINDKYMLTYYIQNYATSFKNAPISTLPLNDQKFIRIEPKNLITNISTNYALLKFISPKRSTFKVITKINQYWFIYTINQMATFIFNQNKDMTEKWLLIPFQNDGIHEIQLLIDSPSTIKSYFFNVTQINHTKIPSIDSLIPKDKQPIDIQSIESSNEIALKTYIDNSTIMTDMLTKKGKDIMSKEKYEKNQKVILDIIEKAEELSTCSNGDDKNKLKEIVHILDVLFVTSKEMYDSRDDLDFKEMMKAAGNHIINGINEVTGLSETSPEFKKMLSDFANEVSSYGNEIIDKYGLDEIAGKVKDKSNDLFDKAKDFCMSFSLDDTKEFAIKTKDKVVNKTSELYDKGSKYLKNLFAHKKEEEDL